MKNLVDYYIKYTERVKDINEAARTAPEELVSQTENLFRKRIGEIAEFIVESGEKGNKIVTVAGPSGSGKTTTAAVLIEELKKLGMGAVRLSLDEFYKPRDQIPLNPDGSYDFETIDALDVVKMQGCLMGLSANGFCRLPHYSFGNKAPVETYTDIRLSGNDAVIVEGLHALNPLVTECLDLKNNYFIYISVKQGICVGDDEVISAQDIRLCRRMVRDLSFRSIAPEENFEMWDKVCEGEAKYINPFKRNASITINSLHIYEPCVIAPLVIPMLSRIGRDSPLYDRSESLKEKLKLFEKIPASAVPVNSLIREFIGGGVY